MFAALEHSVGDAIERAGLVSRAAELGRTWLGLPQTERRAILLTLVGRIQIRPDTLEIHVLPHRFPALLNNDGTETVASATSDTCHQSLVLTVPARLKRAGFETRFVIDGPDAGSRIKTDHSLHRLLGQAHRYREMVMRSGEASMNDLAEEAGVVGSYFTRILRLSFLAPDIVKVILRDQHPVELTANRLSNDLRISVSWDAQRALLGIG